MARTRHRRWLYNRRPELAGATVGADRYGYAYDSIGNRLWSAANAVTNFYTANCINQYTLVGRAVPSAPGSALVYDADGNLTNDGVFSYSYDAENRLIAAYPISSVVGALAVENRYDHRHRRIRKIVKTFDGEAWKIARTHTFVWDGSNIVLERVESASGTTRTFEYFWGADKSGTEQGAGGVGGLLYLTIDGAIYVPAYDNNGNITRYLDANGNTVAQYTYDAFGKTISATGALDNFFRHRFSTKYFDPEARLYYYGFRFYSSSLMRWPNRDPIEEEGGINLHQFCKNGFDFDAWGLTSVSISIRKEFKEGKLGESEFLCVEVTTIEPPKGDGHLNFIQLKNPGGHGWSVDYSGQLGPYYYNRKELNRYSSFDAKGRKVITLYDSPGGAISEDVLFYVAVVEVDRKCKSGKWGAIKCYDKVKLVDSRTWTYHPSSKERYTYRNMSAGQGMLPTLKELINKSTWKTELCSTTEVEVQ